MTEIPKTKEDWLECVALPDYVAMIPAGCIRPIVGPTIWVDGNGTQYSTEAYIKKWGYDPHIAWEAKKEYRKTLNRH